MINKQIQIKLENLEAFHIQDDAKGKVVKFNGSGFNGMQLDVAGTFIYSEQVCGGTFNIYNTHYKDHTYNQDQQSAVLILEKNDDEENVGVSYIHGDDTSHNIGIDTLSLF